MGITAPEYWEYKQRKSQAHLETVLGVLAMIGAAILGLMGLNPFNPTLLLFGGILFIIGIVLVWDADEKLKKIKHIYWTKQAIREYDEKKYRVLDTVQDEGERAFLHRSVMVEPLEVEILPEKEDRKKTFLRLLEKLDERLIEGKISEATYKELREKYKSKINQSEDQ